MLKYYDYATTFSEFPDEIALCINISNCPCHCDKCSEPWLQKDIGEELTETELKSLINKHPGISLIGFMGGDSDHTSIINLSDFIHSLGLKTGIYSGLDYIDLSLASHLDYYKIGAFRMFTGNEATWKNQTAGPIVLPTSNQLMFRNVDGKLVNITDKFRKHVFFDWKKTII